LQRALRDHPRALRRALAPGTELAVTAMVEHWERVLARRDRTRVLALAGPLVIGVAVLAGTRAAAPACDDGRARAAALTGDARLATIAARFDALDPDHGAETWARARAHVDAWASAWADARDASCRATHVEGTRTHALLERSIACLDRRAAIADARLAALAIADRELAARAIEITAELPSPATCIDDTFLAADVVPPEDPGAAIAVAQLRSWLAHVEALRIASPRQAAAAAHGLRESALAIGYGPLDAEVLHTIGVLARDDGRTQDARASLVEAHGAARRSEHAAIAAVTALDAAVVETDAGNHADARVWIALARVDAQRSRDEPELPAELSAAEGRVLVREGHAGDAIARYRDALALVPADSLRAALLRSELGAALDEGGRADEAIAEHQRAIAALARVLSPRDARVADARTRLAQALAAAGRMSEALAETDAAIATLADLYGADSPRLFAAVLQHGNQLVIAERLAEGGASLQRALALAEAAGPPRSPDLALALGALGDWAIRSDDPAAGLAFHERAVAMERQAYGPDSAAVAFTLTRIAECRYFMGELEAARAGFLAALAAWERSGNADHHSVSMVWVGLAATHVASGAHEDAKHAAARVLDMAQHTAVEPTVVARADFMYARALVDGGGDLERARALVREGAALARGVGKDGWAADHEAWIERVVGERAISRSTAK
ncbi:MAG TPA: tetratricopeptide repeat protein, partial [Nannocystaceae bacterium]|nr:tetratricopeptide repeat protein [Nannocystaceae bacterium]